MVTGYKFNDFKLNFSFRSYQIHIPTLNNMYSRH